MKTGKETPRKMASGPVAQQFIALCNKHDITPTKRQLSKFRNKKGKLYAIAGSNGVSE
jgi:hypothetical protein